MNRSEYIERRNEIDEEARALAVELIQEQFPGEAWGPKSKCKLWSGGMLARVHLEYAEDVSCGGGFFEVNFLNGSILYVGPDFNKMASAAERDPANYTVEQRGGTTVFTVWRGSEAAVMRFEDERYTGHISFQSIQEDTRGSFIQMGRKTVRRGTEGA